jgi:hypothetical protein
METQSHQHTTTSITTKENGFPHISWPGEEWMQAKGFSSKYYVSNMGRILTTRKHGGNITSVMKPAKDGCGYLRTVMDRQTVKVHRVVAQTWLPNPDNKPQVNHKDGCKTNNQVTNLEWVTFRENIDHLMKLGIQARNHGEKSGTHIIKEADVRAIRAHKSLHPDAPNLALARELASKYPQIKMDSIRDVLKRKTWKHIA